VQIKKILKSNIFIYRHVLPFYRFIKNLPARILRGNREHPNMGLGELNVFKAILGKVKTIVDVGARYDVDYISLSKGGSLIYFLFEANPKHYKKLLLNLDRLRLMNEQVITENLAVGEKNGYVDYYEDAESVLKNTTAVRDSNKKLKNRLKMVRLEDYFSALSVSQIDFLKTDIEEYDYFALIGMGKLLNKCRFIQFELGIGAPLNNGLVCDKDYYNLLEDNFYLYIVRDDNLALWKKKLVTTDLVILDNIAKSYIDAAHKVGLGFNIFCVNKIYLTDIEALTKSHLSIRSI
jgi:FkbM family methyltransferase